MHRNWSTRLTALPTTALLAVAGCLVAAVPLAQASAAHAADSEFSFSANAFGSQATAGTAGLGTGSGRSAYVILGCTTKPQTERGTAVSVNIPGAHTTAGAVATTVASTRNSAAGTWSDSATAGVAHLSALNRLVRASAITSYASASEGPGGGTVSGSARLIDLRVDGHALAADPAPNTTVNLPGVGSVTLNAQHSVATASRTSMNVNAIVIVLGPGNVFGIQAGARIVIGHATAAVVGPVSGLLSGRSFGTSLTGNPVVNSAPSFAAYVHCTGTGGNTVTNQGAGGTAGPLTVGAITDTAMGTDTASQLSATTTSTVASASVNNGTPLVSVTAVHVQASASVISGSVQTSGSMTLGSITVNGTTITEPADVPPNTTVNLPGATLILNRQFTSAHGIQVEGVYLNLAAVGTVIIGSAGAYA
jgi:hypothetical protein